MKTNDKAFLVLLFFIFGIVLRHTNHGKGRNRSETFDLLVSREIRLYNHHDKVNFIFYISPICTLPLPVNLSAAFLISSERQSV